MFNIFSEKLDKFTSSPYGANNLKINEKNIGFKQY